MKSHSQIFSFFIFILLIILPSCTVEKRIYTNGYKIDWKFSNNSISNQKEHKIIEKGVKAITQLNAVDTEMSVISSSENQEDTTDRISTNEVLIYNLIEQEINTESYPKKEVKNETEIIKKSAVKSKLKKLKAADTDSDKQLNALALVAFIISIISIIFLFPALISILMAAFSVRQFKNNPGVYSGKWMAIIGLIFSYIICAVSLLLFLVGSVFFGSFYLLLAGVFLLDIIISTVIIGLPAR